MRFERAAGTPLNVHLSRDIELGQPSVQDSARLAAFVAVADDAPSKAWFQRQQIAPPR